MASITRVAFASVGFWLVCSAAHADLSISNKPTQNMNCESGVCTATAKNAHLSVSDLTALLASGDTTVKTGGGAITIQVLDGFSWTSASRLTLDANHSIGVRQPVVVAGTGALTITTNDGGSGGDLLFRDKGRIDFWDLRSSVIINGAAYALVRRVGPLATSKGNADDRYALANDYDASVDGIYKAPPFPSSFYGVFEGLGHSVSNFSISSDVEFVGLFADLEGTVRDVRLINASLVATGNNVYGVANAGIIAGESGGSIRNVSAAGSVTVTGVCCGGAGGGLVGNNGGTIFRSSASCGVNVSDRAAGGGLVGYSTGSSQIIASESSGPITGKRDVGGLVGENRGSVVTSKATGPVTGRAKVGGLIGWNQGSVAESFSTATVRGDNGAYIGGLIGTNQVSRRSGDSVSNVYALGKASGGKYASVGGLIGNTPKDFSFVATAYSTAVVTSGKNAGGVVGSDAGANNFSDTFWDLDTSGIADPSQGAGDVPNDPGISGLSDAQLKSGLPDGFDPNIWGSRPTSTTVIRTCSPIRRDSEFRCRTS